MLRFLGSSVTALTAASGTVSVGNAHVVNVQADLAANTTFTVALKPVQSADGTCSRGNNAGIVSNLGVYECRTPPGQTNWIAYRVYNATPTGSVASATDRLICEKVG